MPRAKAVGRVYILTDTVSVRGCQPMLHSLAFPQGVADPRRLFPGGRKDTGTQHAAGSKARMLHVALRHNEGSGSSKETPATPHQNPQTTVLYLIHTHAIFKAIFL